MGSCPKRLDFRHGWGINLSPDALHVHLDTILSGRGIEVNAAFFRCHGNIRLEDLAITLDCPCPLSKVCEKNLYLLACRLWNLERECL
jgi:hypothetical protein